MDASHSHTEIAPEYLNGQGRKETWIFTPGTNIYSESPQIQRPSSPDDYDMCETRSTSPNGETEDEMFAAQEQRQEPVAAPDDTSTAATLQRIQQLLTQRISARQFDGSWRDQASHVLRTDSCKQLFHALAPTTSSPPQWNLQWSIMHAEWMAFIDSPSQSRYHAKVTTMSDTLLLHVQNVQHKTTPEGVLGVILTFALPSPEPSSTSDASEKENNQKPSYPYYDNPAEIAQAAARTTKPQLQRPVASYATARMPMRPTPRGPRAVRAAVAAARAAVGERRPVVLSTCRIR